MTAFAASAEHVELNRRHWDERAAAWHGPLAREHWAAEPCWGLWGTPEAELGMLDAVAGADVVELGCGTAYVSAWLARAGARPFAVDVSKEQLATARAMQAEFGLEFPLLLADAKRLPLEDDRFDVAVSEYGASLWCDPHRWIPEAARVLRPGGRLLFLRRSPLFALCTQVDGPVEAVLRRPQFGLRGVGDDTRMEFTVPHGEMLRLLRSCGFVVEDLIEIQAPDSVPREYEDVPSAWARQWPSEEIWKARLAG
ncbi:class I SAM-dependent methyltransferase [Actinospica durhamensis]|uniref:Class I SAM-dependent methyltransferase n=1 Tax=Actinospica durhamensis TaxID=1508375 RepID=A0A941ERM5_9ACTN|nr:class I SAM-dependent methyltransferase [Actinospica durhamensis]MBR7835898.1 class I SAM-dependent methyltransferase [Actinospica durhamensis]